MQMQESEFIYEYRAPFIFVLSTVKDIGLSLGKSILIQIITHFELIYGGLDSHQRSEKEILVNELKTGPFNSEIDQIINRAILRNYFKAPTKMIDEIESFLSDIFGSSGKSMVEMAIQNVCNQKQHFKKEDLKNVIQQIGTSLKKKINATQANMILQQMINLFSSSE